MRSSIVLRFRNPYRLLVWLYGVKQYTVDYQENGQRNRITINNSLGKAVRFIAQISGIETLVS
jgi:hypothetical protein